MNIEIEDLINEVEGFSEEMTNDYLLKNPLTYGARVAGIIVKIFNAMGIMSQRLDIVRVSVSTKKDKLAWVMFKSKRTVADIFRLTVQNGNEMLGKAMAQKRASNL